MFFIYLFYMIGFRKILLLRSIILSDAFLFLVYIQCLGMVVFTDRVFSEYDSFNV